MKNAMKYLVMISAALLVTALTAGNVLAIGQSSGMSPYGYYGNPYQQQCGIGGCSGGMQYPMQAIRVPCQSHQYPQYPAGYCVRWVPARLVPVRVMVPGRWEYRPIWIPAREITLYQRVPGYWQRTNLNGMPDMSVWRTPNGWYASPYQQQTSGGYFDSQGVWHPQEN